MSQGLSDHALPGVTSIGQCAARDCRGVGRSGLRLLQQHLVNLPDGVHHLGPMDLLSSGLPLDLPDGSQLAVETLSAKNPWVGRTLAEVQALDAAPTVIAVFRDRGTLVPRPGLTLRADDRLLLMVTPGQWQSMKGQLTIPVHSP